jgi:hypothetical protein
MDDLISLEDAARRLGISRVTLRSAIARDRFAARKIGTSWITNLQEVERYRAEQLNQRGRPLESVAIRWPGNQGGHPRLFVTFEGLSAPERRAIAVELGAILATGAIWQLVEAPARMIAADPGHRWDVLQDPDRPSLHFRRREPATTSSEPGVLPREARTSIRQEILPPSRN